MFNKTNKKTNCHLKQKKFETFIFTLLKNVLPPDTDGPVKRIIWSFIFAVAISLYESQEYKVILFCVLTTTIHVGQKQYGDNHIEFQPPSMPPPLQPLFLWCAI